MTNEDEGRIIGQNPEKGKLFYEWATERIKDLESKVEWIQESGASAQQETDRQIAELFNRAGEATRRLTELARRLSDETTRINALRAMHHELADKALLAESLKAEDVRSVEREFIAHPSRETMTMSSGFMTNDEKSVWEAGYTEGKKSATNLFRRNDPQAFDDIIAGTLEGAVSRVKRRLRVMGCFNDEAVEGIVAAIMAEAPTIPAEDAGVWSDPRDLTPRPIKDNPQA